MSFVDKERDHVSAASMLAIQLTLHENTSNLINGGNNLRAATVVGNVTSGLKI